jgi:hypothetical protein
MKKQPTRQPPVDNLEGLIRAMWRFSDLGWVSRIFDTWKEYGGFDSSAGRSLRNKRFTLLLQLKSALRARNATKFNKGDIALDVRSWRPQPSTSI